MILPKERLIRQLEHVFNQPQLLAQALTHRSYGTPNNERLEFLGDSILNCAIASYLFDAYPKLSEGELSRLRAGLVNQNALAQIANILKLGDYLRLGEGELKSGGPRRPSILADALEAIFGAIMLDAGFCAAQSVINRLYQPTFSSLDPASLVKDPKTRLQEFLQGRKLPLPQYKVLTIRGEAHDRQFDMECVIESLSIRTEGSGVSRRTAEQEAARAAYEMAEKRGNNE